MQESLLPSVVSGEQVPLGRRSMMAAAILIACSILPLAKPGWVRTPSMVTVAASAEKVSSLDIPGGFAVDGVGKIGAELFQIGLVDAAADLFVGVNRILISRV